MIGFPRKRIQIPQITRVIAENAKKGIRAFKTVVEFGHKNADNVPALKFVFKKTNQIVKVARPHVMKVATPVINFLKGVFSIKSSSAEPNKFQKVFKKVEEIVLRIPVIGGLISAGLNVAFGAITMKDTWHDLKTLVSPSAGLWEKTLAIGRITCCNLVFMLNTVQGFLPDSALKKLLNKCCALAGAAYAFLNGNNSTTYALIMANKINN